MPQTSEATVLKRKKRRYRMPDTPGGEGQEGPHESDEPARDDRRAAMTRQEVVRLADPALGPDPADQPAVRAPPVPLPRA